MACQTLHRVLAGTAAVSPEMATRLARLSGTTPQFWLDRQHRVLGRGDARHRGVELGEEIRRRHPGLPVILTSGYSHVLAEGGLHGFELSHKPYAAEELSRVLRRVTRR